MGDCQHTNLTNIEEVRDGNVIRGWYGDCADCPVTGIYRPNAHWEAYVRSQPGGASSYSGTAESAPPSARKRWWEVMHQALAGALVGGLAVPLTFSTSRNSSVIVLLLYALVLTAIFRFLLLFIAVESKGGCLGDVVKTALFGLLLLGFGSIVPGLEFQRESPLWIIPAAIVGAAIWGLWAYIAERVRGTS